VTSLSRLLGRAPAMKTVEDAILSAFATVFDRDPVEAAATARPAIRP
jgi:hypothetical protein